MTKLLSQAFAGSGRGVARTSSQDELARVLLGLTGVEQPPYGLTQDEQADLDEADAEIARGEVVTLDGPGRCGRSMSYESPVDDPGGAAGRSGARLCR